MAPAIARRGAAAQERRQRERDGSDGERRRRRATRRTRRPLDQGSRRPAALPNASRRGTRDARDEDHDGHAGQVGEQLLERDPAQARAASSRRTRGCPGGPRRRASPDRAMTDHRLAMSPSEAAGLPADRPAEGLDVDRERVAVDAGQRRRQARDEVARAPAARLRRGCRPRRTPRRPRSGAAGHHARDDDHGEPRVAERLGVDAAQAVDPAERRRGGPVCRRTGATPRS